jgi:hypothetical protein
MQKMILRAVAVGMAVSSLTLGIIAAAPISTLNTLQGLGLFALAVSSLMGDRKQEADFLRRRTQ